MINMCDAIVQLLIVAGHIFHNMSRGLLASEYTFSLHTTQILYQVTSLPAL